MVASEGAGGYVIPRYRAPEGVSWYHVLHGNVPNHQIDFMYCPEVPQGPLTPTHFSHLARLMKYIEPHTNSSHAFAIGNLSRDDTMHEAGHGAVGVIFGFRIGGAMDHAGRPNPPFAHGILAVDRDLGYPTFLETAATFYRHVMNSERVDSSTGTFYRDFMRAVTQQPERVHDVLERYVEEFRDLPRLRRSSLSLDWVADESAQPKRVVVVHGNDEPFGTIAHAAAKLAAMLYRSNIKWTCITSGREADIAGGVWVRIVRERDVSSEDRRGTLIPIDDVGDEEEKLARDLFGAKPNDTEKPKYAGWRERYASQMAPHELEPHHEPAGGQNGYAPAAHAREEHPLERTGARPPEKTPSHAPASMSGASSAAARARPAAVDDAAATAVQPLAAPRRKPMPTPVGPAGTLVMRRDEVDNIAPDGTPVAADAPTPEDWRDVGASGVPSKPPPAPKSQGKAAATKGAGAEEDVIDVTFEKPAAPRRTWIWVVLLLGALAAAAVFVLPKYVPGFPAIPGIGEGPREPAPTTAAGTAAAPTATATATVAAPVTTPPPVETAPAGTTAPAAAPTGEPTAQPAETTKTPSAGTAKPPTTATTKGTGGTRPPKPPKPPPTSGTSVFDAPLDLGSKPK